MADNGGKDSLGFVTCENCGTKNPPKKDECKNCDREL